VNLARVSGTQKLPRRANARAAKAPMSPSGTNLSGAFSARHAPRILILRRNGTMLRLTDAQRAVLVQAFPAVGHLAVGGLVFGQFLREQPFSMWLAFAGITIWGIAVTSAVMVAGAERWTNR
jgi:hypothetical protein